MSSSMFDFHPGIFGFGGLGAFRILFAVVFVGIVFVMLFNAGKSLSQWSKNNRSPRLTVNARVVAKRENVSVRHHHGNGTGHTTRATTYYVTFQFDGGDRSELRLSGPEYGQLAEGDQGLLTFQGTRYLGFERRGAAETAAAAGVGAERDSAAQAYDAEMRAEKEDASKNRERPNWDPEL